MSDILVLAAAFTSRATDYACLTETAERHKVPLTVIGTCRSFPPYEDLFQETIDLLKDRPEPYVMFVDAYDVMVSRWDESEVIRVIEESKAGVVVAAESHCWPPGWWCKVYAGQSAPSPWFAINGGGTAGRRDAVIALVETWKERVHENTEGANQQLMHKLLCEGYPLTLDTQCRIWQTMLAMTPESTDMITVCRSGADEDPPIDGPLYAYNEVTRTAPMFLHFNGGIPGIRQWYRALGYDDWKQTGCKPE